MKDATNILIGGEAGQGLVTVGSILARALVRAGYNIVVTQGYESRIRGGHNTFAVRTSAGEVLAPADDVDVLLALNDETVRLHQAELAAGAVVVADAASDAAVAVKVPYKTLGPARVRNTAALGVAGALLGLDAELVGKAVADAFAKDAPAAAANRDAVSKAYAWAASLPASVRRPLPPAAPTGPRWMLEGNEAAALGAISAGLKFCAFYPMTPSTGIPLTCAAYAGKMGLVVEQAEDEIAAINMALGASYAGAPALVATSGGGFALMVEGVSLAAMTETPVVVVVGQRPAPATGLPTRTEQADLDFVLHAGHGEFPRAVFAPATVEECFHLTRQAFALAQRYQGPVFILTDQFLADSYRAVKPFDVAALPPVGSYAAPPSFATPYRRYAITPDGVSPRLLPGGDGLVVADSDEHTEDGHLTEDLGVRKRMVEKRLRKFAGLLSEVTLPAYWGDAKPDLLFVGWGSSGGAIREAAQRLAADGARVAHLHFSQVWPLAPEQFLPRLEAAARVVSVEGNAFGQLARLIRRETGFHVARRIGRYDGLPLTPGYILDAWKEVGRDG